MKQHALSLIYDFWHGRVHMHTAFWVAWVCPLAIYAIAQQSFPLPAYLDLVMAPYIIFALVGVWRSTKEPPGRLWVPIIYRMMLGLFALSALLVVGLQGYILARSDNP